MEQWINECYQLEIQRYCTCTYEAYALSSLNIHVLNGKPSVHVHVHVPCIAYVYLHVHVFISYSVNQLAEVLRCAIEQEAKILYELKLPGVNFRINQVHTMHTPL